MQTIQLIVGLNRNSNQIVGADNGINADAVRILRHSMQFTGGFFHIYETSNCVCPTGLQYAMTLFWSVLTRDLEVIDCLHSVRST